MKKNARKIMTMMLVLGMCAGMTISAYAGWKQSDGIWYYDLGYGKNATGWQNIDATWYYFDGNGQMLTGWNQIDGEWYYLRSSGAMAHDQWIGNYYVGSSGAMLKNTWIGSYWVGADGEWVSNKSGYTMAQDEEETVLLTNLKTFYTDYGNDAKKKVTLLEDKLGNIYENCIMYRYGYEDDRDIYVLSGDYSKFSGTIFVPDERNSKYDNMDNRSGRRIFYVYGDDELLYYSPQMSSIQYPVDFEIDVSGIDQLAICWNGGASTWYYEIGLSDAVLYKE